jgi:hypothetical protein
VNTAAPQPQPTAPTPFGRLRFVLNWLHLQVVYEKSRAGRRIKAALAMRLMQQLLALRQYLQTLAEQLAAGTYIPPVPHPQAAAPPPPADPPPTGQQPAEPAPRATSKPNIAPPPTFGWLPTLPPQPDTGSRRDLKSPLEDAETAALVETARPAGRPPPAPARPRPDPSAGPPKWPPKPLPHNVPRLPGHRYERNFETI